MLVEGNSLCLIKIVFAPFYRDQNLFLIKNAADKVHRHVSQAFGGVLESLFFENLAPHSM